ncbi:hypothetical protein CWI84_05445 [Idiomarina tyrosinivorans]|uniref:Type II secretion system protein GspF domain-containing protein n=1 Tax=Idiomarina tyrosinivorans TaxID=1445662 RepID=A0A432ZRL8_9GAMM|nr:type II secretion system F family protein [Idiomarina tyrosinivorans]RUO80502.1 hypothetical protein CWI84_05445 [Idiomarina tyrosinivorans]
MKALLLVAVWASCLLSVWLFIQLWRWLAIMSLLQRGADRLWWRLPATLRWYLCCFWNCAINSERARQLWLKHLLALLVLGLAQVYDLGLLAMFIGLSLLGFSARGHRRWQLSRRRIARELPDFCDLLTMMMAAGVPLIPALQRVSQACGGGTLAREVETISARLRQGYDLEEASQPMVTRYRLSILNEWQALLVRGHRQGGSLTQTLTYFSQQLRHQQLHDAEKKAQEAPVKLLFPLLSCFFPINFLIILGPIAIGFFL